MFSDGMSYFEFLSASLWPSLCVSRRIIFNNFVNKETSDSLYFKDISKTKAYSCHSFINRKKPYWRESLKPKCALGRIMDTTHLPNWKLEWRGWAPRPRGVLRESVFYTGPSKGTTCISLPGLCLRNSLLEGRLLIRLICQREAGVADVYGNF